MSSRPTTPYFFVFFQQQSIAKWYSFLTIFFNIISTNLTNNSLNEVVEPTINFINYNTLTGFKSGYKKNLSFLSKLFRDFKLNEVKKKNIQSKTFKAKVIIFFFGIKMRQNVLFFYFFFHYTFFSFFLLQNK